MRLFIGNLPYRATDADLQAFLEQAGEVVKANVVMDRVTGRSRGFGFADMATDEAAHAAIEKLNNAEFAVAGQPGRPVVVREAHDLKPREPRG